MGKEKLGSESGGEGAMRGRTPKDCKSYRLVVRTGTKRRSQAYLMLVRPVTQTCGPAPLLVCEGHARGVVADWSRAPWGRLFPFPFRGWVSNNASLFPLSLCGPRRVLYGQAPTVN